MRPQTWHTTNAFSSTRSASRRSKETVPSWIKELQRPPTPILIPEFGPLAGIRVVSTGIIIAQPYIGTKMAEFGAEVIHIERPGGDTYRGTAPLLTRGPREHSCDAAENLKSRLSLGLNLKHAKGIELLMALWKLSDVWMESSAPRTTMPMSTTRHAR